MPKASLDTWTDEECRYFFHLYAEERKKGNRTATAMNQIGKESIIKKFEEKFKRGYANWEKFRNKYDWGRKQYAKIKKLTHNRTGVGYDAMGRLEMADWWWDDRIKEWPDARKYRDKVIPNMDLFEKEFGGITVTGEEGWSAQQGEASLSSRVNGDDDDDEVDSDGTDTAVPEKKTQPAETQTQAGNSRAKKRRREKDVIVEASEKRTAVLARKNETLEKKYSIAEQVLARENASSIDKVIEILNELPGVRMWSAFYEASVNLFITDEANRLGFIAYPRAEDKIRFLELRTGKKSYE